MAAAVSASADYDIAVVGGGIVGVSAALRAVQAGARVALIDSGANGQASRAGAGIVSPIGLGGDETSREWSHLVASAINHYRGLLAMLNEAGVPEVGFGKVGELALATRDEDMPHIDKLLVRLKLFANEGIPVGKFERRGGAQLQESWPELRDGLEGIYIENIARMDGRRMCAALGELATAEGVTFISRSASLGRDSHGKWRLLVDGEPFPAATIVLAPGAWSQPFLDQVGVRLKVEPDRGQIVHLSLEEAATEERPILNTFEGHYFLGFPSGRIVTGATHEPEAMFDSRVTAGGVHSVLSKALAIAPGLGQAGLLETRVGLRPRSSDGYPIVGRPRSAGNVVVATGLGAWGLTLGPLLGSVASEQALGLTPSYAAEFLSPDREPIISRARSAHVSN